MTDEIAMLPWFRVRFRDGREIEIHAADALRIFENDLRPLILGPSEEMQPPQIANLKKEPPDRQLTEDLGNENLLRISKDSNLAPEAITKVLTFTNAKGFKDEIPILSLHPEGKEAVQVIIYLLQVGQNIRQVEFPYLKDVLTKGNGYPFPGDSLAEILKSMERRKQPLAIRFQSQAQYRPLALSTDGLESARMLLRRWCSPSKGEAGDA